MTGQFVVSNNSKYAKLKNVDCYAFIKTLIVLTVYETF